MRIGIFHQAGLLTDPAGDCCGARARLESLAMKYYASLLIYAWDDPKSDAAYANMLGSHDVLLVTGHSHGAGEIIKKTERPVSTLTPCKIVAGIIDDCPFGEILTPFSPPRDPPAVKFGVAVWQRNFQPMGRAFIAREGFIARELSEYSIAGGPVHKLGHVAGDPTPEFESIAGDFLVWTLIEGCLLQQIAASSPPVSVNDAARVASGGVSGGAK
jgi:hypothetical protein